MEVTLVNFTACYFLASVAKLIFFFLPHLTAQKLMMDRKTTDLDLFIFFSLTWLTVSSFHFLVPVFTSLGGL